MSTEQKSDHTPEPTPHRSELALAFYGRCGSYYMNAATGDVTHVAEPAKRGRRTSKLRELKHGPM